MPTAAPLLCKHVAGSEWGDGVASCHGSVLKGGQGGDCLIMVRLGVLGRPHGGGGAPWRGEAVELCAIVAVGNPDHLAVAEAGGRREAHRSGVNCG